MSGVDSRAVAAAARSCATWFPEINRIRVALGDGLSLALGNEAPDWNEATEVILRIAAEFAEHEQTISQLKQDASFLAEVRSGGLENIRFDTGCHFAGPLNPTWTTAFAAVSDETERFLRSLVDVFDPRIGLHSSGDVDRLRAVLTARIPSHGRIAEVRRLADGFCIQNGLPDVCGDLRERIEHEVWMHSLTELMHPVPSATNWIDEDFGLIPEDRHPAVDGSETVSASQSLKSTSLTADSGPISAAKPHGRLKSVSFARPGDQIPDRYRNPESRLQLNGPLTGSAAELARAATGQNGARKEWLERNHNGRVFVVQATARSFDVYFDSQRQWLNAKGRLEKEQQGKKPVRASVAAN